MRKIFSIFFLLSMVVGSFAITTGVRAQYDEKKDLGMPVCEQFNDASGTLYAG